MSRIRSIHPGLFSDESFMTLTIQAPLCIPLLLGLWTEADDGGVFEWKLLTLKAKILPAVGVDMEVLMSTLVDLHFIRQFSLNGKDYGAIRNFKTWQRPKQPKLKHPKVEWVEVYVGGSGEPLPHDFPTDGEMSPQREEEGGRREEEGDKTAPHSGAAPARGLFNAVFEAFPLNPSSDEGRARHAFERLIAKDQNAMLGAARRYALWFGEECESRKRSREAGLRFVPHLSTWIEEGAWRNADELPVKSMPNADQKALMASVEYIDRLKDPALFAACERIRKKPAPETMQRFAFAIEIVAEARKSA